MGGKADRTRRRTTGDGRERRDRPPGQERRGSAPSGAESPESLIAEAVNALARGDETGFLRASDGLTVHAAMSGTPAADRTLLASLQGAVTGAWQRGWQPADVVRFTGRRLGTAAAALVTDMVAAEMRRYAAATVDDQWAAQLSALDARVGWQEDDRYLEWCGHRERLLRPEVIALALRLLALLGALPRLASLGPPPGQARGTASAGPASSRGAAGSGEPRSARPGGSDGRAAGRADDQRLLGRIRALLAKAESTEFPEEAEALSSRAQELMARHSIDHALLAAEEGAQEAPGGRRLGVDNPYEGPKAVLLNVVANANRCRAIWHKELGLATVLGFPGDLDAVELLYTSLLVQADAAMLHSGPRQDRGGRSRTRSFRHAFLSAYAQRIGERLAEAKDEAVRQAVAETTGQDLLPVLAARDETVDRAVETMFPKLVRHRAGRINNYEGWVAGRAAADLAALTGRSEVTDR